MMNGDHDDLSLDRLQSGRGAQHIAANQTPDAVF
jgi:hypothetical protein